MSPRDELIGSISRIIGRRQLVWFGTRGDDIESVVELPQLSAAFSVISAYRRRSRIHSLALEDVTGIRVDLDDHDIDEEPDAEALTQVRRALLRSLSRDSCLFTYRPSTLVSAVCFARRDRVTYLGMFKDHQVAFEHKPWVESSLAAERIPALTWHYIADDDQRDTLPFLRDGAVMLRRSRGSGGVGLSLIDDPGQLEAAWPRGSEAFVSVSRYVEGGLPVNVGATVYADGVTVGLPSVQLIGLPELTDRPFGYCGNDFGAAADLDDAVIDQIDGSTSTIGLWLRKHGYIGSFGVDYLVKDGVALFTEVNPRFQGSTHLASRISAERDEPCLLLEHLAAHLGLPAPERPPLRHRVRDSPDFAHIVAHWLGETAPVDPAGLVSQLQDVPGFSHADVLTSRALSTAPGATVARVSIRRRVTSTGFDVEPLIRERVQRWHASRESSRRTPRPDGATQDQGVQTWE